MASRPELRGEASGSSTNPQNFLLSLLNQASAPVRDTASLKSGVSGKHSLLVEVPEAVTDLTQDVKDVAAEAETLSPVEPQTEPRKASPIRIFGEPTKETSAFEPPASANKGNVFTYLNPFEQLSASSPLNQSSKPVSRASTPKSDSTQRAKKSRKMSPEHPSADSDDVELSQADSSLPLRPETVSEAVSGIGEQVNKEVTEALAQATSTAHGESVQQPAEDEEMVQGAAAEFMEELKDEEARGTLESGMPNPMAEEFETTIKSVAEPEVPADWQDADSNPADAIRVFNFPMRPFVSIEIQKLDEPPRPVSSEMSSDITRMKKDFDQIDRNLVTASQNFIVYSLKESGFRLIRQDNGDNKEVFKRGNERIFNVALGRTYDKERDTETLLGTGVNGSVFWTSLIGFPGDSENDRDSESRGFIFPPLPTADDNQAGSQLKTRVKASTRHPSYFGYGRGKSIYIVWPELARSPRFTDTERICDTESYLNQYKLQVHTGKAAKDFTFSADDTVIASLDKVGKLKFWDIRKLTDQSIPAGSSKREAIKDPITTLVTHVQDQKTWPTSLMFIDKERPMSKGIALRYLIVGMKQNHTLQLWDLSLGKPVQEINFPHESESDAICSLVYHPKTGVLVVGHPTRNTIYLLHVSSPKYNLAPMSQAKFLSMVASKDTTLPIPDSTIIVSGVREYALGKRGQLRSLDILDDLSEKFTDPDAPYFELYVMQAKGVSVISFGRQHLGWSKDGKILNGVDAVAENAINLKTLQHPSQAAAADTTSTNGDNPAQATPASTVTARPSTRNANKPQQAETLVAPSTPSADPVNGGDKSEKKKKKKATHASSPAPVLAASVQPKSPVPQTVTEREVAPAVEDAEVEIPGWATQILAALKSGTSTGVGDTSKETLSSMDQTLNTHFNNLYRKVNEDRRVLDAANNAKQDALLRLVSSTLTENIEPTMDKIVSEALKKMVLGPVKDILVQNVDRNLADAFSQSMKKAIPREIEKTLPPTLQAVFQDQGLVGHLTEKITQVIDFHLRRTFEAVFEEAFVPAFQSLSIESGKKIAYEVGGGVNEQLRLAEQTHQQDTAKIDALLNQVHDLQRTVTILAENQAQFQSQLMEVLQQSGGVPSPGSQSTTVGAQPPPAVPVQKTAEEIEAEEISQLMNNRDYEQATVKVSDEDYDSSSDWTNIS